jgi:hypothetical protein
LIKGFFRLRSYDGATLPGPIFRNTLGHTGFAPAQICDRGPML